MLQFLQVFLAVYGQFNYINFSCGYHLSNALDVKMSDIVKEIENELEKTQNPSAEL